MSALLSDCGVGLGVWGRGNREGDLLPLSWPRSTQISWPLPASRVFQGVHRYCLRSSVSDLENAITTSSAPADRGKRTVGWASGVGLQSGQCKSAGAPVSALVCPSVVLPSSQCFQGSLARGHASSPTGGWQGGRQGGARRLAQGYATDRAAGPRAGLCSHPLLHGRQSQGHWEPPSFFSRLVS